MSGAIDSSVCPISGDMADRIAVDGDFLEYHCPTCGTFRVSQAAMTLAGENHEVLHEALVAAKSQAQVGAVPVIDNLSG